MIIFLGALALLLGGGAASLLLSANARRAAAVGAGSAVMGSLAIAFFAIVAWTNGAVETLRTPWAIGSGTFFVEADALSAVFLLLIATVSASAAVYGYAYLLSGHDPRGVGGSWLAFNALVASMALAVVARNAVLFLVAWESMALASFLLVMKGADDPGKAAAGWTYLVATHLGTAFVIAFFVFLGAAAGSSDFDAMAGAAQGAVIPTSALFVLALVGFGTKAGIVPFHVWLPEAHSAAPSHVSAVMSGAMIKVGIVALVRALALLGGAELWWGWALIALGSATGILGVLHALAQHDLKRLLAYHSVENIGIITLGLGVAFVGVAADAPVIVFLGLGGALLHCLNHAVFKGLLFLGAGAVQLATGTRDLERLGGLLRRMPGTGTAFLTGSAAISGLPPLNGFVSEFLIFAGAFTGAATLPAAFAFPLAGAVFALALIGGLAAACFAKAVGSVFLGVPRTAEAAAAREVPRAMVAPQLALAGLCATLGLCAPLFVPAFVPAVATASGLALPTLASAASAPVAWLSALSAAAAGVLALVGALTLVRARLLRGRAVTRAPTWDCGYGAPTARMQYTASSFASPLTGYFRHLVGARVSLRAPTGLFPSHGSFRSAPIDPFVESGYRPAFLKARRALGVLLPLQNGRVQLYVLYIALTVFGLILWEVL